mmetsp:Transcript_24594/g.31978  ORF Transcript_24594/g.31978 Transcript_24594/m.31978 type:complete len:81 (-) Transcript_24594:223-465(-)
MWLNTGLITFAAITRALVFAYSVKPFSKLHPLRDEELKRMWRLHLQQQPGPWFLHYLLLSRESCIIPMLDEKRMWYGKFS